MWLQLCDSNTCLFSTLCSNFKRTDLIFANKNMAFRICLVNSIGLAVIKHMTIDSITGFCNSCKSIIKGNHVGDMDDTGDTGDTGDSNISIIALYLCAEGAEG
jgi:hypothetical protein